MSTKEKKEERENDPTSQNELLDELSGYVKLYIPSFSDEDEEEEVKEEEEE